MAYEYQRGGQGDYREMKISTHHLTADQVLSVKSFAPRSLSACAALPALRHPRGVVFSCLCLSTQTEVHAQVEHFREAFNLFDTDGGGSIDIEELGSCLRSLGQVTHAENEDLPRASLSAVVLTAGADQRGPDPHALHRT